MRSALRDGVIATMLDPFQPIRDSALIELATGQYPRAMEILNEGRAALDRVENPYAQAQLLAMLANTEAMIGEIDEARADAERALAIARRLQNPSTSGNAFHAMAWALQRDDPAAALAATEQYLDLHHHDHLPNASALGGVLALAGGLRSRLGDHTGALENLREAASVSRDQGARPQLAATLDWSLSPLVKLGRPKPAAMFIGALTNGSLAEVSSFPGVDAPRARNLERARAALGDEPTNRLVKHGAAMTYDEITAYALDNLGPA
jgi:tetratricopeptide (TPR) repeat protein